jgi:hypothetical protein
VIILETWKDIAGYEGMYQVSNTGKIKSLKRYRTNYSKLQLVPEKIKSLRKDPQGYLQVDLYKNNKQDCRRIHRVVAEAFIPNPENKPTVNHIDGDRNNNDVTNLEWADHREQNIHFYENNLKSAGSIKKAIKAMNKANSKKTKCLNDGKIYESASAAARVVGVSPSLIMRVCRGKGKTAGKDEHGRPLRWKYV